jgi:hypothetical protein
VTAPDPSQRASDRRVVAQLADCLVELRVAAELGELHGRLADLLAHSVDASPTTRRLALRIDVADDGARTVSSVSSESSNAHSLGCADDAQTVAHVLTRLNETVLLGSGLLTVHAGVVRARDGVVAWPAASGAGKSTLVAAALLRGYGYLSDEALCLDADGRAVPYPKPLTLDPWAVTTLGLDALRTRGDAGAELAIAPHAVGATVEVSAGALAAVVLLRRDGSPALVPAGSDEAVAALLRHSFNHWRMPGAAVDAVHRAVQAAGVYRLSYDDPRDGVELLLRELPPPSSSTVAK